MHSLADFKNFACAELDLFRPLTVLLGRNGSGKTNLIESIELLSTLARGAPLNEITNIGRDSRFQVRGSLRSCLRFGTDRVRLRFHQAVIPFDRKSQSVDYFIEITSYGKHGIRFSTEKLKVGSRIFFEAKNSTGEFFDVEYDNF